MDKLASCSVLINGVNLTPLGQIVDERGGVLHMLRADSPDFVGFGECYFSEIFPGAIKAWKRHFIQTQNLAVPVGRVRMVIYDSRERSSTCGSLQQLELGRPDAYLRLQIPPGVWYGFACLGKTPALVVNCPDIPHKPTESECCPLNNTEIPYEWTR